MNAEATPEQQAAMKANMLRNVKNEFTRLTVALLGTSYSGNPVEFVYGGQAESPDGKADIVEIKGANDFTAKLFVDGRTRRPVMMSWQAPNATVTTSGPRFSGGGSGGTVVMGGGGSSSVTQSGGQISEDRLKEMMAAAQKMVEHRWYFSEYRDVDGVKLPFQIVRSIDGNTTEELTFEKFKLNAKIDEKKFKN